MRKHLYAKLAVNNLRKNARTYVPYLLTCILTVAMFYILVTLSSDAGLQRLPGSEVLGTLLTLGCFVVGTFAVIFLLYTHSFLIKRRKKEFGLFNILGMEKRHLAKLMALETLYTALLSLSLGLGCGVLLSKLMRLILLRLLNYGADFAFAVSLPAILYTAVLFCGIFLVTLVQSLRQVHLATPVELLRGGQVGEREPKTRWFLSILGVVTLGAGYWISLTTTNPVDALLLFFVAVMLVIVGTYCLFTAGSVALLKALRKRKQYYYQTRHFISVSGLLYRMKQNAVGLANICILSTMVLVMLSSTTSLYLGMEDALRAAYPEEISISTSSVAEDTIAQVDLSVEQTLTAQGVQTGQPRRYRSLTLLARRADNHFTPTGSATLQDSQLYSLSLLPLEDYNRLTGNSVPLAPGQIWVYSNRTPYSANDLTIFDQTFEVAPLPSSASPFSGADSAMADMVHALTIIVPDFSGLQTLSSQYGTEHGQAFTPKYYVGFDVSGDDTVEMGAEAALRQALKTQGLNVSVGSRASMRQMVYSLYGGLFFLGIFLAVMFLMATVLILYYKQISEGHDDRERFSIMQKVGLSHEEIRRSIRSQIVLLFFLPLITACIHIAFAFPVITRMLAVLNLSNTSLFATCTVAVIVLFAILYAVVYALTARSYYRIVRE